MSAELEHEQVRAGAASEQGATEDRAYVTPRIVVLGTVADLTRGANTGGTDGLMAGSAIH
ncbi:MAG TPA: lasso RiPP family leader peptide-containing protein [Solirubrobacteraceae bacterium]|jgi:hypothetical protein